MFSHCFFKVLNIFRWRNDAELAEFAWRQPFPQLNQPVSVNMLLTEQSRPEWNPHRRDASPLRTIAACNTSDEAQSSQQSDDLSLMDCEAIDVPPPAKDKTISAIPFLYLLFQKAHYLLPHAEIQIFHS